MPVQGLNEQAERLNDHSSELQTKGMKWPKSIVDNLIFQKKFGGKYFYGTSNSVHSVTPIDTNFNSIGF